MYYTLYRVVSNTVTWKRIKNVVGKIFCQVTIFQFRVDLNVSTDHEKPGDAADVTYDQMHLVRTVRIVSLF